MMKVSRVRSPVPYTSWIIFTFICFKNVFLFDKTTKINKKKRGWAVLKIQGPLRKVKSQCKLVAGTCRKICIKTIVYLRTRSGSKQVRAINDHLLLPTYLGSVAVTMVS